MTTMEELFGPPIYAYTADDALEDGVLVEPYPERMPHFLLTTGVYEAVRAKLKDPADADELKTRLIPFMVDAAMIVKAFMATVKPEDSEVYPGRLFTEGLEGNVTGETVWIAMNEKGGLTLLFPSEN